MWNKIKNQLERFMPMTLASFVLFAVVVYLMIIVGKTVWDNFQSNKQIEAEQVRVDELEEDLAYMENEIEYFKTSSFREKQARAKLGYIAPGEKALSLPTDETAPGDVQSVVPVAEAEDVPNYYLWLDYFTE